MCKGELRSILSNCTFTQWPGLPPLPCTPGLHAWLQSWCLIGADNRLEECLQQMVDEFGSYFVLLPATKIADYANLLAKASGQEVRHGLIRYSENPRDLSLTTKDARLSYQNEFRFYVGTCTKFETQDKHLHLKGLESLLADAGSLKLTSAAGKNYYFGLGAKRVVVA